MSYFVFQEFEYVLIKVGPAPKISFRKMHDLKQIDDLDMTLIITYDKTSRSAAIKLHYYIVLTTNRYVIFVLLSFSDHFSYFVK